MKIFRFLIIFSLLVPFPVYAADYYIAQSAAGNNDATSCVNAKAISYLTGSWSGKVSAGDTLHLCGTLTSTLTIGASGTNLAAGAITVKFERGSKFSKNYWTTYGAITATGKSYIIINGDNTGVIECTDNGDSASGKGNDQLASAINFNGGSNIIIKNLIIQNIYLHTYNTKNGTGAESCGIKTANTSNVWIYDNTVNNCKTGILTITSGSNISNINIYGNTISSCSTAIIPSLGDSNTMDTVNIYNNDITMGLNWYDPSDANHVDGIHMWGYSTYTITNVKICNNYFHGDPGGHSTAALFTEGEVISPLIYNNVFTSTTNGNTNGFLCLKGATVATTPRIYNNTFVGVGISIAIYLEGTNSNTTPIIENNIIDNVGVGIYKDSTMGTITSDYNDFYNTPAIGRIFSSYYTTLANWRTALGGCPGTGHECNSIASNPDLNADYTPKGTSPVLGAGVNLTSLGIAALNNDKNGVARPATGAWDIGAYEYPWYSLTINISPSGSGSVTSSPSRISCNSICSANFVSGTSVELAATANSGYTFTGWSVRDCSGTRTCNVDMTAAQSVIATFTSDTTNTSDRDNGGGSGGCFIATAAYGSYLDPHVCILRNFRDNYLLTNYFGKKIIAFYYRHSPIIAKYIASNEILKKVTRWLLTPVVYVAEYFSGKKSITKVTIYDDCEH